MEAPQHWNPTGRAVLIPFFRYTPHTTEHYKHYFNYFVRRTLPNLVDEFDTLYLINGDAFDDKDYVKIPQNVKFKVLTPAEDKSHWNSVQKALEEIDEEHILLLDQDVIIQTKGVVDSWFEQSEQGSYVTAFDGSKGGRIAPYYSVFKKSLLDDLNEHRFAEGKPPIDFVPDEDNDSFGKYYRELKRLYPDLKYYSIDDPRHSLLLLDDNIEAVNESTKPFYYHMRNGNLGCYLLTTRLSDKDAYNKCLEITPKWEALRLLAWFEVISVIPGDPYPHIYSPVYREEIISVVNDLGVSSSTWRRYMNQFREYHNV